MPRFILISVLIHVLAAGMLHHSWSRPVGPLTPGDKLVTVNLLIFSDRAIDRQGEPVVEETDVPATRSATSHTNEVSEILSATGHELHPEYTDSETVIPTDKEQPDPGTSATAQSGTENTNTFDSLRSAIYSALRANFKYPRRARLRGWEGTVVIALRILPNGETSDVRVTSSSGIIVLDQAARRSIQGISVPQVVAWLDGKELDIQIPIEYRLTDS